MGTVLSKCVLQWPGLVTPERDDLLLQVDVFPPQATNFLGMNEHPTSEGCAKASDDIEAASARSDRRVPVTPPL